MTSPHIYLDPQNGYDVIAPYYDDWEWQKIWAAVEFPHIRRILEEDRDKFFLRILDIGVGTGRTLHAIRQEFQGAVLTGVDLSESMLEIARSRLPDKTVLVHGHARRITSFTSSSFSHTLFCRVGSHIPNLIQALAEATRVTLPGGKIFASDIHPDHHYTDTHRDTPGGTIHIETHKHSLEDWHRAARNLGLAIRSSHVVHGRDIAALPGITHPKSVLNENQPISMMMVLEKD